MRPHPVTTRAQNNKGTYKLVDNMPEDKVEVRINQAINFIESHELCPTTFKPLQLTRSGVSQAAHLAAARLQRLEAFAQGCSRRRGPGLLSPARARRVLLARASAGRRRCPLARPARPPAFKPAGRTTRR